MGEPQWEVTARARAEALLVRLPVAGDPWPIANRFVAEIIAACREEMRLLVRDEVARAVAIQRERDAGMDDETIGLVL
jgi:hypothetical protein